MKMKIWLILLALVYLLLFQSAVFAGEPPKNCQVDNKAQKPDKSCKEQKGPAQPNDVCVEKDIPYLDTNIWQKLDLYTPSNIGEKQYLPCIVNIHGGGWKQGDKSSLLDQSIAMELARNGYICANINYTLSVFGSCWPRNLYDCKTAIQFLRKNAQKYHIDPNHIGAIGTSAGGHLAAMVGLTGPAVGLEPPGSYKGITSRVQAVVPMYGAHNLNKDFGRYVKKRRFIASFLGAEKEDDPNLWAFASPVSHVSPDDPPFLFLHGTLDETVFLEQSIELDKKLRQNGIESRLISIEAGHGFGLQPEQRDLRPAVITFFDKHLKTKGEKSNADCKEQKEPVQPSNIRIVKDIPYLGPDTWIKLDLYMPANLSENQRLPAIVNIHGGGWKQGDKSTTRNRNIATELVRNGYICVSINYTLCINEQPSWPQNLYDCKSAVQFLRKNAKQYHVDPNHIGAIGASAGGHLSAMVGLTGPEVGLEPPGPYKGISSRVQAVVPMYGVHDFNKEFSNYVNGFIVPFLGATKENDPNLWSLVSPVSHVSPDDPPFLLLHGTLDKLVPLEQSIELDKKLRQEGIESQLVSIEAGHSFGLNPEQRDLRPDVITFFDRHLKGRKTEKTTKNIE